MHQPDVPHGPQLVVGMPSLLQAATTGFDPRSLNALPSATAFATVAAVVAAQMLVEVVIMMGRSQPTRQHSYCCCTGSG